MVAEDTMSLPDSIRLHIHDATTVYRYDAVLVSDELSGADMDRAIYQFANQQEINGTDRIVVSMCRRHDPACRTNLLSELATITALSSVPHCAVLQSVVVHSATVYRSDTSETLDDHRMLLSDGLILYEAYDSDAVTWLNDLASVTPADLYMLLDPIAQQLACMYAHKLVYVDIKPDNILVKRHSTGEYMFALCDLGSVLDRETDLVYGDQMSLSPMYACRTLVGTRLTADVYGQIVAYALGVLYHAVLTPVVLTYHHAKRLTWLVDSDDCGVYARMLSIVQTTIRMNSVVVQAPPVLLAR